MNYRSHKRYGALVLLFGVFSLVGVTSATATKIPKELLSDVRSIHLERKGYVLGQKLTEDQLKKASNHMLPRTVPGTFRFQDGDVQIVAEEGSNIVITISENHPNWSRKSVKDLIGEFTLGFGFPTTSAHGRTLYWYYSADGRLLGDWEYQDYVVQHGRYSVIATIKIQTGSDLFYQSNKKETTDEDVKDSVYYLIYSNPILELFVYEDKNLNSRRVKK